MKSSTLLLKALNLGPAWLRDAAVSIGSARLQRMRRSGVYSRRLEQIRSWRRLPREAQLEVQRQRLSELIEWTRQHSPFYRERLQGITVENFGEVPFLEKSDLQHRSREIVVGDPRRLIPSFTGGTTGASITVYNGQHSLQERFAYLDLFWEEHGFKLGIEPVAWFSGRHLIAPRDERQRRFWRTNWINKVRYYSTFHMSGVNLDAYISDLNSFRPAFLTGFPSAITEVARFARSRNSRFEFQPKAIFVTSESLDRAQRSLIEEVFNAPVRDQYSASEGAPFITECRLGRLHMDLTSGVVEVIDDQGRKTNDGEMIVTCFFTRETPIIRYRIGDSIRLSSDKCECGWDSPLVDVIHGRAMDYVEVPGRGRIFNSQIGDCVKDVPSVWRFQVEIVDGALVVDLLADRDAFEQRDKPIFLKKIAERMGDIPVHIRHVAEIPRAPSGKHSMVRRARVG